MDQKVLYEDSTWKIYEDAHDGLMANYMNSCKYKVTATESCIIRYLCKKIQILLDLSNSYPNVVDLSNYPKIEIT